MRIACVPSIDDERCRPRAERRDVFVQSRELIGNRPTAEL
jgi:hypothetical protein